MGRRKYSPHSTAHYQVQDSYPRALTALWLARLLLRPAPLLDSILEAIRWALPDMVKPLQRALDECAPLHMRPRKREELEQLCQEDDPSADMESFLRDAPPSVHRVLRKHLREALERIPLRPTGDFRRARHILSEFFALSPLACDVCELLFCIQGFTEVENCFENCLNLTTNKGWGLLAHTMGCSSVQLREAIQTLRELGVVDEGGYMRLGNDLEELWLTPCKKALERKFYAPLSREIYPLEEFSLSAYDREHIQKLLRMPSERPVHILLYGAAGAGKSSFVASLASHMGVKLWASPPSDADKAQERRASIQACSVMARNASAHGQPSLVVVDEADALINVNSLFMNTGQDKAWLNNFLEQPACRSIWIANNVWGMDESVARRFSYSVHFPDLETKDRAAQWRRILERARVASKVTANDVQALAEDFCVPMGIMAHAVERSKTLYGKNSQRFLESVRQHCTAFEKLRHNGATPKRKHQPPKQEHYNVAAVCLDNAALTVPSLLQRMKAADALWRSGESLHSGACTLLFYGPPGTGKTALAQHLATELGRPCHAVQASDWLDMYVGGTEQNMARAFARAQESGAVLVIDEADSFAFSRDDAQRSWESSMVNEFLTNLEKFKGFCVCTTNRQGDLDKAALRRFTFKVPFTWASKEAALALYADLLAPLADAGKPAGTPLSASVVGALHALAGQNPGLAPGDFRAVRAAFTFATPEERTHEALLKALHAEVMCKAEPSGARMGFNGAC